MPGKEIICLFVFVVVVVATEMARNCFQMSLKLSSGVTCIKSGHKHVM